MPKESTKETITTFAGTPLVRVVDGSLSRNISPANLVAESGAQATLDGRYAPQRFSNALYYGTPVGSVTNSALVIDRSVAVPLDVGPSERTLDRIAISVSSAGGAGAVHRLGIYDDDGTGRPGSLILDAGTVDCTTTGDKEITISQAVSGLVWLTATPQVAVSTIKIVTGHSPYIGAGAIGSLFGAGAAAHQHVGVSGALPSTFVPSTAPRSNAPLIGFRFSA